MAKGVLVDVAVVNMLVWTDFEVVRAVNAIGSEVVSPGLQRMSWNNLLECSSREVNSPSASEVNETLVLGMLLMVGAGPLPP